MATFSVAARNAAVDAVTALLDSGSSRPSVAMFTAGASAQITNQFLRSAKPTWGAASGGVASLLGGVPSALAVGTGIASVWTMQTNGPSVVQLSNLTTGSVGLVGSGAEIELTNTSINTNQLVGFTSFDIAML